MSELIHKSHKQQSVSIQVDEINGNHDDDKCERDKENSKSHFHLSVTHSGESNSNFQGFSGFLKSVAICIVYCLIFLYSCSKFQTAKIEEFSSRVLIFALMAVLLAYTFLSRRFFSHLLPLCVMSSFTASIFVNAIDNEPFIRLDHSLTIYSHMLALAMTLPGAFGFRVCKLYLVFITALIEVFGLAQYYSGIFRESPLRPVDLKAYKSAIEIRGSYSLVNTKGLVGMLISLVNCLCIFFLSFGKGVVSGHRISRIFTFVAWTSLILFFTVGRDNILDYINHKYVRIWVIGGTYKNVGNVLFFYVDCWLFSKPLKPEGYSVKKAKAILSKYETHDALVDQGRLRKPNIIVILSETFCDYTIAGKLKTNKDFMPFIRNLKNNTVRGDVTVTAYAGGTCNSEYEFLTGNSISFYPKGTGAYLSIINAKQESLVSHLNNLGYETMSFTASQRSMWNTGAAYGMLKFKKSYFENEYYNNKVKFRKFPTDKALFDGLIRKFEEKPKGKPVFMFLTTMQNHGNYEPIRNPTVRATDFGNPGNINTLLTGLKLSDEATQYLIEYFSKVKEDTVVVFFGDHFPHIPKFTDKLLGMPVDQLPLEKRVKLQTTPFFIWANYKIEKEEDHLYFGLNYLSSKVMEVAGLPKTPYMKFLDDMRKHIPLLTPFGYGDSTGKWYSWDQKTELSKYLDEYFQVQHLMVTAQN